MLLKAQRISAGNVPAFDVNETDKNDETALHLAATNGHDSVSRLLIHSHAHVEAKQSVRSNSFARFGLLNREDQTIVSVCV
jgi:hypothetical protein